MYLVMFHWIGALERRQKTRRFCMRLHWVLLVFCQLSFHPIVEDIQTLLWGCCSLIEVSSSDFWSWLYDLVWPVKSDHAVWSESEQKNNSRMPNFGLACSIIYLWMKSRMEPTKNGSFIPWNSHENMSHVLNILGILTWNTCLKGIHTMHCLSVVSNYQFWLPHCFQVWQACESAATDHAMGTGHNYIPCMAHKHTMCIYSMYYMCMCIYIYICMYVCMCVCV